MRGRPGQGGEVRGELPPEQVREELLKAARPLLDKLRPEGQDNTVGAAKGRVMADLYQEAIIDGRVHERLSGEVVDPVDGKSRKRSYESVAGYVTNSLSTREDSLDERNREVADLERELAAAQEWRDALAHEVAVLQSMKTNIDLLGPPPEEAEE